MKGLLLLVFVALIGNSMASPWFWSSIERSVDDRADEPCDTDDEGKLLPHNDCDKYYTCTNNRLVEQTCPAGTLFNPRIGECDFPERVPECKGGTRATDGTGVPPNPTPTMADLTTEEPRSSESESETDPANPVTSTAAPEPSSSFPVITSTPDSVAPESTTEAEDPEESTAPPAETTEQDVETQPPATARTTEVFELTTEGRICLEDGIYTLPVPGNCSIYILCAHGVAKEQICPPNTLFDPDLGVCNLAELVKHCNPPLCQVGEVVLKPVPGNCRQFIICADGETQLKTCPEGMLFDPEYLQCNLEDSVECPKEGHSHGIRSRSSNHIRFVRRRNFLGHANVMPIL